MDFKVLKPILTFQYMLKYIIVTEDLVRYMQAGHDHGGFLVEDPQWAIDFAPNGV